MVPGSLSVRRRRYGYLVAVGGTAALTAVLVPLRGHLDLTSDALLFLLLVVSAAILGGLGPALVAGALGALLLNFFFTTPFHTLRIQRAGEVVAVLVFATVALMVSWVVDLAARRASAAREAAELEAGNRLRTALLAAVGHDLRTPLATAKAVVSGLRSQDVELTDEDRRELLETADEALDRLAAPGRQPAGHEPAAGRRAAGADPAGRRRRRRRRGPSTTSGSSAPAVVLDVPERPAGRPGRPRAARAGHREPGRQRTALRPPSHRRCVAGSRSATGSSCGSSTAARASPSTDRDRVFLPFQRLGDTDNTTGVGLGLALSRGLTEAMGGTLDARGHPRRRADHGRRRCRADAAAAGAREPGSRREPDPGRRRRAADPARPRDQPPRARLRGPRGRRPAPRRSGCAAAHPPDLVHPGPRAARPRRHRGHRAGCAAGRPCRSWSCPGAPTAPTRWTRSTPARTTTSPSRSAWTSCWPGCARCSAAAAPPRTTPGGRPSATSPSTSPPRGSRVRRRARSGSPRPSGTCWRCCVRHPGKLLSQRQLLRRGVGTRLRDRAGQPAALHGAAAPQARARPGPPAAPPHRAGHGLPLRAVSLRAGQRRARPSTPRRRVGGAGERRREVPRAVGGDEDVVLDPDADAAQLLGDEQVVLLEVEARLDGEHHALGERALGVGLRRGAGRSRARPCRACGWCRAASSGRRPCCPGSSASSAETGSSPRSSRPWASTSIAALCAARNGAPGRTASMPASWAA